METLGYGWPLWFGDTQEVAYYQRKLSQTAWETRVKIQIISPFQSNLTQSPKWMPWLEKTGRDRQKVAHRLESLTKETRSWGSNINKKLFDQEEMMETDWKQKHGYWPKALWNSVWLRQEVAIDFLKLPLSWAAGSIRSHRVRHLARESRK